MKAFHETLAHLIDDKKGHDIKVISLKGISPIADYFIIASGSSSTQLQAISDHIDKTLRPLGHGIVREGDALGGWLLIDLGEVVVHLFSHDMRAYYGLERIWADAPLVEWS